MSNEDNKKLLNKALNFCYFYLKFRPRTKREIVLYLKKKAEKYGFTEDIIEKTVEDLTQQNFINDKDFVKMYVESKIAHKPKGEVLLRNELQKLRIQKELLDDYFSEQPINQDQQALQALESKWYRFTALEKRKRFEKAAAFLSRRGFSFEVIKKTIAELEEKEYNIA